LKENIMSTNLLETTKVLLSKLDEHPENVRSTYDEASLKELAQSIESIGLISPLTVREVDGRYQIIAGHRRFRALQLTSIKHVSVIIRELSDAEVQTVMLIENVQREDISPIDEARGYLRLTSEFGFTNSQLAKQVGKSPSHITRRIALLKLADTTQQAIVAGTLSLELAYDLTQVDAELRKPLEKSAAKGNLQKFEVDGALRKQERIKVAAKLRKLFDDYGVKTTTELLPYNEHHLWTSTVMTLEDAKEWTPKRGEVVYYRDGDAQFTLRTKLTAAQIRKEEQQEAAKAEAAKKERVENATPWDLWDMARIDHQRNEAEARRDWDEQVQQYRVGMLDALSPRELAEFAVNMVVNEVINEYHRYLPFFDVPEGLTGEDADADRAEAFIRTQKKAELLRAYYKRAVHSYMNNAKTFINHEAKLRMLAEGLSPIEVPAFDLIEPWIDANGEWVLDRPVPVEDAPYGYNEITGEPISEEEYEAMLQQAEDDADQQEAGVEAA
jgi:ParB family transcriptional regulator, chromosome partitioning protein